MSETMNLHERFQACFAGNPIDRLPRVEWAPWWLTTVANWQLQGLPIPFYDVLEIQKYFGLDPLIQFSTKQFPSPYTYSGSDADKNMEKYKKECQEIYNHSNPFELLERLAALQSQDECTVWLTFLGFFWFPRTLFGIEDHFYAFYDQPQLMHLINRDQTRYIKNILSKTKQRLPHFSPTFVMIAEDMSYNHGPMLSKELFYEFLAPYYREIVPAIKETFGCQVIVDSDGLVDKLIPWLLDVGVDGILPLERQSGVDANALREKFPDLIMIGNYDKRVMDKGEGRMREEFERLIPVIKSGKFIPSVDHQTPPNVSMQDYALYKTLLDEYTQA